MVAAMVPKGSVVCDIGCDHGFVSIELIRRQICPHVIASDVRTGPLERAREHVSEAGLSEQIELRLSDGLREIRQGEADGFLAAGMGGKLMIRMITDSLEKVRAMSYMILQPQSELQALRRFLRENDFRIMRESMVFEEGKYYFAMLVSTCEAGRKQLLEQEGACSGYESLWESVSKACPEVFSEELSQEKITELADQYGPFLILQAEDVLMQYLSWKEEQQRDILPQVASLPEQTQRVERELQQIRLVKQLLGYMRQRGKC